MKPLHRSHAAFPLSRSLLSFWRYGKKTISL